MTHMDAPVVVSVIAAKSDAPEEDMGILTGCRG